MQLEIIELVLSELIKGRFEMQNKASWLIISSLDMWQCTPTNPK